MIKTESKVQNIYDLTPMQEGMLFHNLFDQDSGAYIELSDVLISGSLDIALLEETFNELIARHDVLRTVFLYKKVQKPREVVLKERQANVHFEDLSEEKNAYSKSDQFVEQEKIRPFELSKDCLIRLSVLKLDENSFRIVWGFHHIIMDGWCMGILMNEFFTLYASKIKNTSAELEEPIPFGTYLSWLSNQNTDEAGSFWKKYLEPLENRTPLELKKSRSYNPTATGYVKKELSFKLEEEATNAISEVCKKNNVSLNVFVQTVWSIFLQKINGGAESVFGTVVSGRPAEIKGVENILGLFINTIPVYTRYNYLRTFENALKHTNEIFNQTKKYDYYPLPEILNETSFKQDLFDHILVFENFPLEKATENMGSEAGLKIEEVRSYEQTSYDFNALVFPGKELGFSLEYNNLKYTSEEVDTFKKFLTTIINQVLSDPEVLLKDIRLLQEDEFKEFDQKVNTTQKDFPESETVLNLIEEVEGALPAIQFQKDSFSYKHIATASNTLKNYLIKELGIQKQDRVAILMDRSEKMIASILAVLKAGAAYIPIDPSLPEERIDYIIADSESKLLITDQKNLPNVSCQTLNISSDWEEIINGNVPDVKIDIVPEQTAYIIYTSGSTGKPKGCEISHGSLLNYIQWANGYYFSKSSGNFPLFTSISFDLTITSIFCSLTRGKTLTIYPQEMELTTVLKDVFSNSEVDTIKLTPAHISILKELNISSNNIQTAIVGGDQLTIDKVRALWGINPDMCIFNEYGPTEATVGCVVKEINPEDKEISIGRPIDNMQVYVLDEFLNPVPNNVPGELYLGGKGLAKGYLNNKPLTEERFVQVKDGNGKRLYKTGDVAYWGYNKELFYIGRNDFQLKIRGYRVELEEIEKAIIDSLEVEEVVVKTIGKKEDPILVAYYIGKNVIQETEWRKKVSEVLPDYMIPQFLVKLDQIPLTVNGKVDLKLLPDPMKEAEAEGENKTLPHTQDEKSLAELWKKVLGVEQVFIEDHFFQLGGHSLKTTILASLIQKEFDKDISVKKLFSTPLFSDQVRLLEQDENVAFSKIQPVEQQEFYPLSFAQRRIYILQELNPNGTVYNMPAILKFTGEFDVARFEKIIQTLTSRHEVLRTSFHLVSGEPMQKVHSKLEPDFQLVDGKDKSQKEINNLVESFIQPFDLSKAPLFRTLVIQQSETEFIVAIDMHHIIGDGVSSEILIDEITTLYAGKELNTLEVQYKDFAAWQQQFSQTNKFLEEKKYWLKQFEVLPEVLELPYTGTRPKEQTFEGASCSFKLEQSLVDKIKSAGDKQEVSAFMMLLGVFKLLLYKYSGQKDIVVGTPVSGRTHAEVQDLVGVFINTLPVRTELEESVSFTSFLNGLKLNVLNALDNQDYPFEELVEELKLNPDLSRNPLFDVMFILQNSEQNTVSLGEVEIEPFEMEYKTSKFDLTLEVIDDNDNFHFNIEYDTALFDKTFIERFYNHFEMLLDQALTYPDKTLSEFQLVTEAEKEELLSSKSGKIGRHTEDSLVSLFITKAEESPEEVALVVGKEEYSYKLINEKSNALAQILVDRGVGNGDVVGIQMGRSVECVISMLAIIKSGAAYVVIDENYPAARQQYILEDSNCKFVLVDQNESTEKTINIHEVDLHDSEKKINHANPNDLAYIIYTSGSTGMPKGVMIEHRNAISMIRWAEQEFANDQYNSVFAGTSFCFDLSVFEIFYHLIAGKKIRLLENALDIKNFLSEEQHILLNTVPSVIAELISSKTDFSNVACINMAGEPIPLSVKQQLDLQNIKVRNLYGPSEDTTYSSFYHIKEADSRQLIGKPVSGTKAYILDKNGQLVPKGIPGELYLSGTGVVRGYLGKDEETKERFLADPFCEESGVRMYKTGDLVRWTEDWNLEYLGRTDDQVKIRGFRIEPGEIASIISKECNEIREVAVIPRQIGTETHLCAYLVSNSSDKIQTESIREHLLSVLPEYMVPAFFVELDKLPLTPNGKVNKKALPDPAVGIESDLKTLAETVTEKKVAQIWQDILEVDRIYKEDNFFKLGGHSLKATQVVSKIQKELQVAISLRDIFSYPKLEKLASRIDNMDTSVVSIPKVEEADYYPLSNAQKRLWVIDQIEQQKEIYNMPGSYLLEGNLNVEILNEAFQKVIERQESLRTVFKSLEGEPVQKILPEVNFQIEEVDLSDKDNSWEEARVAAFENIQLPFDLEVGPLFRALLLKVEEGKHIFVFTMHHIISDGWSLEVMMYELSTAYQTIKAGQPLNLEPLSIQYKDYAQFQNERIQAEDESYWLNKLSKESGLLKLPYDFGQYEDAADRSKFESIKIDADNVMKLQNLAQSHGTTLSSVIFSVFNILLSQLTGQSDIQVGLTSANRTYGQVENLIGFFVNMLVIRTDLSKDLSIDELIEQSKQNLSEALEHQNYPFDLLVEKLSPQRVSSKQPLVNVTYTYQNLNDLKFGSKQEKHTSYMGDDLKVSGYDFGDDSYVAKFDLMLYVEEVDDYLELIFEYNSSLFKQQTIIKYLEFFKKFLKQIVGD